MKISRCGMPFSPGIPAFLNGIGLMGHAWPFPATSGRKASKHLRSLWWRKAVCCFCQAPSIARSLVKRQQTDFVSGSGEKALKRVSPRWKHT